MVSVFGGAIFISLGIETASVTINVMNGGAISETRGQVIIVTLCLAHWIYPSFTREKPTFWQKLGTYGG